MISRSSPSTHSHHPGGLWTTLDHKAAAIGAVEPGVWTTLAQTATPPVAPPAASGIYTSLVENADPAQYRPHAIAIAEEQLREDGQTYTVLRSASGNYLRLTDHECALWHAMDGTRTVAQLGTMGFIRFKQLLPVVDLVQTLRAQGFLTDTPVQVYQQLTSAMEARTAEGWGRRVVRALRQQTFAINSIDRFYTALYRACGWIAFTRPAQILALMLGIAGCIAFFRELGQHTAAVLPTETNLPLDLLALYGALLVSFVLHESAHALAVKHHGRRVLRGGVMLYFGLPAAFVDTSDIWVAGRKARIVVSAAGPASDLLVGGIAALVVLLVPGWAFAESAYRLAMACYVATLFNLNPLLELDGYFIVVDALRLPNLRQRALAFVGGPLWHKLQAGVRLSREERILRIYGLLTLVYTAFAIVLAGIFWQRWLSRAFAHLQSGGWAGKLIALLLVVLVIIPIVTGALLAAWGSVRAAATWLERRGYGRSPVVVTAALVLFVALLAFRAGTPDVAATWLAQGLQALCWAGALIALLGVLPDYRGAALARAVFAFAGSASLALMATVGALFLPAATLLPLWGVALLLLVGAGFIVVLDVDLRSAPAPELIATALSVGGAFAVGVAAVYQAQLFGDMRFSSALLRAAPAYCGALALALCLPYLLSLRDSRLFWSWALLWSAMFVQTIAYVVEIAPAVSVSGAFSLASALDVMAAGLWASAWAVQLITLRYMATVDAPWPNHAAISESERLQRAFQLCYAGCYQLFRAVYGRRRTQALDDRMDVIAATANWDLTFDHEQARIGLGLMEAPLDLQGDRYAEGLRYTVATIEELAGASFARRAIRAAYDALPWAEREAANRRCFPDTPWAAELSQEFGSARAGRLRLLRQVGLFAACNDDELAWFVARCQVGHIRAGRELLAAGVVPPGLWIVEAGEVAVWSDTRLVEELHRAAAFGATTRTPEPARHSYRAMIDTTFLFLPMLVFGSLLDQSEAHLAAGAHVASLLGFLERVPLFANMPRSTLHELARTAHHYELAARTVLVREGVSSGVLYLIRHGQAAVITRSRASNTAHTPDPLKMVAQLGPEEFFGEIELLRSTPPVASVVALTSLEVFAIPHSALHSLVVGKSSIARDLEQIGSGRMLDMH